MAFGLLLALALTGLLPTDQVFAGFGSPVVVAVAAVFVVSAGLDRTGVAELVSRPMRLMAGRSYGRLVAILMLTTGGLSAVMNNVAAVGVLLPVAMAIASRRRMSPSLLLMPLVYAARFGGNLLLIAAPTNLLLAEILQRRGVAHLGIFHFLPIGLPLLIVGTAWMATIGRRLLPERAPGEPLRVRRRGARLAQVYRLSERLFEARIPTGSPLAGKTIAQSGLGRAYGLTILAVRRRGEQSAPPSKDLVLRPGDQLVVKGRLDELLQADAFVQMGLEVAKDEGPVLDALEGRLVEAIVAPRSSLADRTLRDIRFRDRYGLTVLAVWREGRPIRTRFGDIPLRAGDGLLIQGPRKALATLGEDRDLILLDAGQPGPERMDRRRFALLAVGILIALTVAGIPVAVSAALAAGIIILSGGLTAEEAYRAVDWRTLVLIGAMVPMGVALDRTGAAGLLAGTLARATEGHPLAALAALLLTATAIGHFIPALVLPVIFAPLAIHIAAALHVSPLPYAMAIIAAAGLGLLTPFGNPVMLMAMAPAGYRPRDYVRAGLPLAAVLFLLMLVVLPLAYRF